MPSITIDSRELEFQPGESIIQVAERNQIEIPYYCWHPQLSVAANCRMCLVEVEKAPKLLPACQTDCRDGMVVHTKSERVGDAQRAIHELLLINHPIDCPICDQAGECKLQDYYMKFHLTPSRMADEKEHKPRYEPLGPHVLYNGERCILCTRCIRFMEEVAKDRQLGVFHRGDHAYIGTAPGYPLDNPYSLNTVDVCPVGALTSRAFRFKQRVWNLRRSESLCGGCARGCNIWVDQRSGQVYRLLPRDNDDVNQCWMCDEGRLTYRRANENRLTEALVRDQGGTLANAEPATALLRIKHMLGPIAEAGSGLAAALSLHATCEEAYVFGRLARDVLRAEMLVLCGFSSGEGDDILRVEDRNPNRNGIERVLADLGLRAVTHTELTEAVEGGTIKALFAVGHETDENEVLARLSERLEVLVHVAHARAALAEVADIVLPSVPWVQADGTWVNAQGRAQRLLPAFAPVGSARGAHEWMMQIGSHLGVSFALPEDCSVATIRAEMERRLESFKGSRLTDLGSRGRVILG